MDGTCICETDLILQDTRHGNWEDFLEPRLKGSGVKIFEYETEVGIKLCYSNFQVF